MSRLDSLRKSRLDKLERIRKLGIDPYPARLEFSGRIQADKALKRLGKEVVVAGRLMAWREHGGSAFIDLEDDSSKIQLFFKKDVLGEEKFEFLGLLDFGDFIEAKGKVFKTKAGEITIEVKDFNLLTKSIRPIPSKWHGLKDVEERYRKRYLDLLLNPEIRKRFDLRSKLIRAIQEYLDGEGYVEVETPTLQTLYGGTNARPFETYLNALKMKMYLRVADELYLKRLVVGGYEKIYEICKDFRNEGIDLSHNPEFTMIEFYEAYADYHRIMAVTEGLIKFCAKKLFGEEKMKVKGKTIDLSGNWPKIEMTEVIKRELDLDVEKADLKKLTAFCRQHEIEVKGRESKGELIYTIFDHLVPSKLMEPTWVIDYPIEVSPLCKQHPEKEGWVERFEGYIGGEEICDGWSEVNDPLEQRKRFESDQKARREGRMGAEAHPVDENFLTALEYGMPTLGGIGIGIDRLLMFFTDTWSIKELIFFPIVRPKKK